MATWGSKGTNANARELFALLRQAGASSQDAQRLTALALAETGGSGQTNAWNPVAPDDSYSPWQINRRVGPNGAITDSRGTPDQLVNPQYAARAALAIYKSQGPCAWSTYDASCGAGHTGSYRSYLAQAQEAALNVQDLDIDSLVGSLMARIDMPSVPGAGDGSDPYGYGVGGVPGGPGTGASNPIGDAASAVGTAVHNFGSPLEAIGSAFAWLTVPGHWWAIAFIVLGAAGVLGGFVLYARQELGATIAKVATA